MNRPSFKRRIVSLLLVISFLAVGFPVLAAEGTENPAPAAEESTENAVQAVTPEDQYNDLLTVIQLIRQYGYYSSSSAKPLSEALAKYPNDSFATELRGMIVSAGTADEIDTDEIKSFLLDAFTNDPDLCPALLYVMLAQYDRYTQYIPVGSDYQFSTDQQYVGIGVSVAVLDDQITILAVSKDGPAANAGILPGDVIAAVDGTSVTGMTLDEVSLLLRGEEGTYVDVTILRNDKELSFTLQRAKIGSDAFVFEQLEDGVYYIKFDNFNDTIEYLNFVTGLQEMKEDGDQVLILDLRDDLGGQVDLAANMVNRLLPSVQDMFSLEYRPDVSEDREVYRSDGTGMDVKVIILTNGYTASAAELVTASLSQLGYAVTVGETTFGKACGQIHVELSDGSVASITIAALHSPDGIDYGGIGLVPDYQVDNYLAPYLNEYYGAVPEMELYFGNCSDESEALNQALSLLGYLQKKTKIYRFDEETSQALKAFCAEENLEYSGSLTPEIAKAINDKISGMDQLYREYDAQLAYALDLARQYLETADAAA